ncbi:hypothetical protein L5515_011576 [Caenorhabditis briggsae]|uniref:Uncharacterized protein n=1 Tax=Caenorhabditis briggsae TaxID=6238 RepID=A0AAE9EUB8_CAEBR|nr:hypothetical protein L5515_011576 [Caenorhabditis briggsae]
MLRSAFCCLLTDEESDNFELLLPDVSLILKQNEDVMPRSKLISRSNFLEKRCPKLRLFSRFTATVNYCITRFDCVLPVDSCRFTASLEAEASGKQWQLWTAFFQEITLGNQL